MGNSQPVNSNSSFLVSVGNSLPFNGNSSIGNSVGNYLSFNGNSSVEVSVGNFLTVNGNSSVCDSFGNYLYLLTVKTVLTVTAHRMEGGGVGRGGTCFLVQKWFLGQCLLFPV